ncbi:MAG: RNA polymerase sigma factor [Candidatus Sumerlaeia bacterium]|nr:RNA polymerase sigma factor [Candidatus Sumerlaeia bacterium]
MSDAQKENRRLDDETFRRFRQGDSDAATRLVRLYHRRLVAYLRLTTGSLEIAEEIAQEAFYLLYRERESLRAPESVLPWILRTAQRLATREMQRRHYRDELSVEPAALASLGLAIAGDQEEVVQLRELAQRLEGALERLKPPERELIVLRFFAGLQIREISETLDMPMGSVGVKLRRSLDKLRTILEEQGLHYEDFQ